MLLKLSIRSISSFENLLFIWLELTSVASPNLNKYSQSIVLLESKFISDVN